MRARAVGVLGPHADFAREGALLFDQHDSRTARRCVSNMPCNSTMIIGLLHVKARRRVHPRGNDVWKEWREADFVAPNLLVHLRHENQAARELDVRSRGDGVSTPPAFRVDHVHRCARSARKQTERQHAKRKETDEPHRAAWTSDDGHANTNEPASGFVSRFGGVPWYPARQRPRDTPGV